MRGKVKRNTVKKIRLIAIWPVVGVVLVLCIWGPESFTKGLDNRVLRDVHVLEEEEAGTGYRYALSSNERLYLLSACLDSRLASESNDMGLDNSYAFVVDRQGSFTADITQEDIYDACNREMERLKEVGVLPADVRAVEVGDYDATLYTAIEVPEPRNNLSVWKVSLSGERKNINKENRLIDAYLDAENGKIYEFYVRTSLSWQQLDASKLAEGWRNYMGLEAPRPYESDNPLLETTPLFQKFVFDGMDGRNTVVTVGYYEGIGELFLKISK